MTVQKSKPKQFLQPITTGANSAMNQSEFLAITCNSPKAREKIHAFKVRLVLVLLLIGRKTGASFKPVTKCSNSNHVITFDSHLKSAL